MQESDIEQIVELETKNFDNQLALSKKQIKDILENENYKVYFIKENEKIITYAIIFKNIDFDEIIKIVVDFEYRRKGYAKKLLSNVFNTNNKKYVLEVDNHNISAVNLYKCFNFVIEGERKNYYGNGHNAILMSKD